MVQYSASHHINHAIRLLNENNPHRLHFEFESCNDASYWYVNISLLDNDGLDFQDETSQQMIGTTYEISIENMTQWERLGEAIGRNTSLRILDIRKGDGDSDNDNDGDNNVDDVDMDMINEVHACIEAINEGLEMNNSIETLDMDMDLYTEDDDGKAPLPIMNLDNSQFKERLNCLTFNGGRDATISNNQSFTIASALESMTLESFDLSSISFGLSNESAFRRIALACSNVNKLDVRCSATSHFAAIAALVPWRVWGAEICALL